MEPTPGPDRLPLTHLERRCAEQTERFFQRATFDPSYCFELFRRALGLRDELAWQGIYDQYGSLVQGWVQRHAAFSTSGESAEYFVNRAFEKMWVAVAFEFPFPDLKQVLRYLQMCVHSALLDHVRAAEHAAHAAQTELPESLASPTASVESQVLVAAETQELWRVIVSLLNDADERAVVYGSFALGLTPRELCRAHPQRFSDVRAVYRIKENVLARLRRDRRLRAMFEDA